ncbi:MAG: hypothetical protein M3O36_20470 [Myxococcota bacterium]|nr:hypothetical protein [Myxococcota bacterium]
MPNTEQEKPMAHAPQSPNNDEKKYLDHRASYSKGMKQSAPGIVDADTYSAFAKAVGGFDPVSKTFTNPVGTADFDTQPLLGGNRKLNGPLGAFGRSIAGTNPDGFGNHVVPPAPELERAEYATELVELYWASLLRDTPFGLYVDDPDSVVAGIVDIKARAEAQDQLDLARCAVAELDANKGTYAGPLDGGKVTLKTLFRGGGGKFGSQRNQTWFHGEEFGPYISQFCVTPTALGAVPITPVCQSYAKGVDYMTNFNAWKDVQKGAKPAEPALGDMAYLHDGRGLGAYTRVDELYQAYFVAYLVMKTLTVPTNPGNPYEHTNFGNAQPFGTFGGPDIASTLGTVAKLALNVVWYQKWVVHRRHRPESGGGLVHMLLTGQASQFKNPDLKLHDIILESEAVKASAKLNGNSFLLSQAFPEGSPTHPAYPTGHGAVAGACITILKFFFKNDFVIPKPLVTSLFGNPAEPPALYTGADKGKITVNGELHKLAHNISFGHGIHPGIHWRGDTDYSVTLGEAVALDFLRAEAHKYRERFSVDIVKADGNKVTISNA